MGKPILDEKAKAWLATGLEELRQAVHLNHDSITQPNVPGTWGVPTTGEATAQRLEQEQPEQQPERSPEPEV